jgi:alternate signal-mediated exported protein
VVVEGSDTSAGIDDQWEIGSDADSRVFEGRDRSSWSASEAVTEPVHAGGEDTNAETVGDGEPGSTALVGEMSSMPRRKLLGAIATIGSAAALGGSGTSAFFGDNEEFANNTLVAGDLDLKVDWTEHYSDWSDDEAVGIDVSMEPGDGLVGFPSTASEDEQSVFVDEDDVQTFLANTAIEAFPDQIATDDPDEATYDAVQEQLDDDLCELPADVAEALSHPYRTRGTFPADEQGNAQTTVEGDPLVNITDLKPGDFGEVTFSFHLCGNPGYIWLTGALREAAENEVTEPEGRSPDEEDGVVELLDAIQVALWYDTGPNGVFEPDAADKEVGEGDNFFGPGEQLIPLQGSLRNVLSMLESSMFPLDAEPLSEAVGGGGGGDDGTAPTVPDTGGATIYNSTEDEPFASDSPSPSAPPKNFDCADYQRLLDDVGPLVGSTAKEADELLEAGMSFSSCGGSVIIHDLDIDGGSITVSTTAPIRIFSVKGGRDGENVYVWPESVYLDEVTLTTPTGQAISNVDVCCTVDGGGGGGQGDPERQCFENSTTAYVGFEWWIPMDVGNEIQTDSISFDLGFYTEQCRHNDGSGMANRGG